MKLSANRTCFGQTVSITRSSEKGVVTGFSVHMRTKQPQFYVQYANAMGVACEAWFFGDELTLI